MTSVQRVSVHGGHSGQYCGHARDSLAEVVAEYARQGFAWVGISEHAPPAGDAHVSPEEAARGMDAAAVNRRFGRYFAELRALQERWRGRLRVLAAIEVEVTSGWREHNARLVDTFEPDYVVGSVHHVDDVSIDSGAGFYSEAVRRAGSVEALYCRYFDLQHELLEAVRPAVIGHFDLVRMLDPDYERRFEHPEVAERVERNLQTAREIGAILDLNLRAFAKGQREPFPSRRILARARELGVGAAPGDDSHGVLDVGKGWQQGLDLAAELGLETRWPCPA
jgi:histidinol-phosphatase (PHP family)